MPKLTAVIFMCLTMSEINIADIIQCNGQNSCNFSTIKCINNAPCNVYCTETNACSHSTVICREGYECNIVCNNIESCLGITILCATDNLCTINCTSARSCRYSTFNCPRESDCRINCYGDCGTDHGCRTNRETQNSCVNSEINCPLNGPCNIQCGFYGCTNSVINGGLNGKMDLTCFLDASCRGTDITCPQDADCFIDCGGGYVYTCGGSTVKCPTNHNCFVDCGGWWACDLLEIDAKDSSGLAITTCTGDGSSGNCRSIKIWCPVYSATKANCFIEASDNMYGLDPAVHPGGEMIFYARNGWKDIDIAYTGSIYGVFGTMYCLDDYSSSCEISTTAWSCTDLNSICMNTPTSSPTIKPTISPTSSTLIPSNPPSTIPTSLPTTATSMPSSSTFIPTPIPTFEPTISPSSSTLIPSNAPSNIPTSLPTFLTSIPTKTPSTPPTVNPTKSPTNYPTVTPTHSPSKDPTLSPTHTPTSPTEHPTETPTFNPSISPSGHPSHLPTNSPTNRPTAPSVNPTLIPTFFPSDTQSHLTTDINYAESAINHEDGNYTSYVIGLIICCIVIVGLSVAFIYHCKSKKSNAKKYDHVQTAVEHVEEATDVEMTSQLKKWLDPKNEIEIPEEYYSTLIANGYDRIPAIKTITSKELNVIGIDKIGHASLILQAVEMLKNQQVGRMLVYSNNIVENAKKKENTHQKLLV